MLTNNNKTNLYLYSFTPTLRDKVIQEKARDYPSPGEVYVHSLSNVQTQVAPAVLFIPHPSNPYAFRRHHRFADCTNERDLHDIHPINYDSSWCLVAVHRCGGSLMPNFENEACDNRSLAASLRRRGKRQTSCFLLCSLLLLLLLAILSNLFSFFFCHWYPGD